MDANRNCCSEITNKDTRVLRFTTGIFSLCVRERVCVCLLFYRDRDPDGNFEKPIFPTRSANHLWRRTRTHCRVSGGYISTRSAIMVDTKGAFVWDQS